MQAEAGATDDLESVVGGSNGTGQSAITPVLDVVDGGRFNGMWGGQGGGSKNNNGRGGTGCAIQGFYANATATRIINAQAGDAGFIYVLEF